MHSCVLSQWIDNFEVCKSSDATIGTRRQIFLQWACAYRSDAESALRDLPSMKGRKSRTLCDFAQLQTIGSSSKSRKALSCAYHLHLKVCKGSVKFKAQILADPKNPSVPQIASCQASVFRLVSHASVLASGNSFLEAVSAQPWATMQQRVGSMWTKLTKS